MENFDTELRRVLVKVTDCISGDELRKIKFIFADEIRREGNTDTTINGAIDFFQQLLDRGIIGNQNLSQLISALNDVGCHHAAEILTNYQFRTLQVIPTKGSTLLDLVCADTELDKQSTVVLSHRDIDEQPFNLQQNLLLDNPKSTTSRLTIYDKTSIKPLITKYSIYLIIFLIYTVILILLLYYVIPKVQCSEKPLPIKRIHNQTKLCRPSLSQRYFIKSLYSGKLIGVLNTTSDQGDKLYQWNDHQNQSCNHQWYFVPLLNRGKDKIYIIQSVYNRKVFDVTDGNISDDNKMQQWDIAMNNINQQFRLIRVPKENSCQIQSLVTDKVLNAITKEFITQTNLKIEEKESIDDKNKTLWQLIPFDIDRPGDKLTDCPYVSSINDLTVIKYGNVFGDDGGYSTDDSKRIGLTVLDYISSISVGWSDWLTSMECIYSSSNPLNKEPSKLGFPRGTVGIYSTNYRNAIFNVTERNPNERINRVYMNIISRKDNPKVSTRYIVGIQFHTTFNRTSPFYGSRQGQLYMEENPGFVLGYVRGGAHIHIERLQFIWYKV